MANENEVNAIRNAAQPLLDYLEAVGEGTPDSVVVEIPLGEIRALAEALSPQEVN